MPAFYDKCQVNFTLFTKIQTKEAVGYRPTETENFSLPQSAMKAYSYNMRQNMITKKKKKSQFCRHRMFDRASSTILSIRVRLAFDLVAVLFCGSSAVHSHCQPDINCFHNPAYRIYDFEMKGRSIWNTDVLHVIQQNIGLKLLSVPSISASYISLRRSLWPRGLRRGFGLSLSGIACSNSAGGIDVCLLWVLCVLSRRCLCDGLITRLEESY